MKPYEIDKSPMSHSKPATTSQPAKPLPRQTPLSILDLAPVTAGSTPADALRNTRELAQLADRAGYTRYWLAEHEAFAFLVSRPEDLRDDRRRETTFRQARTLYARAKELGFRGLVFDAEDYDGVTEEAKQRYAESADYVDAWCFSDEFGPGGMYYLRGRQLGQVLAEVWHAPLMQVYEARMYAGKPGCRDGNYWWLRGIHDAGIEVWIATEKTYGAGQGEIETDAPAWLRSWFVQMPEFMAKVYDAYPFAARVLPGFHPWNHDDRHLIASVDSAFEDARLPVTAAA